MSSETQMHNLLLGTGKVVDSADYQVAKYALAEPLVVGRTYTVSAYVEEVSRSGSDQPVLAVYDGADWWSQGHLSGGVPGVQSLTFTYKQPFPDHADPSRMSLFNTPPNGNGVTHRARLRDVMLVEGTEPAAWAPAEDESLPGGGAQMSANLLDGATPKLMNGTTSESDGVWHNAGRTSTDGHQDWLVWDLAGQSALATNQTYHVGLSVKGASANSASLHATIGYRDAAGNANWATSDPLPIGTSWGRVEATIVVPSGMTPFAFYVAAYGTCPETWMASPTLSYGSPVTLASSAHTPYATQDHVSVTYATKASLKVTDDSIKAEVSARAQTDRNVADLSSRLTQTANSLTSEISDRRTAITTVTGLANAAQSTADAAKSSASNAVSTANSASSSAANAVETANAASSAASAASTAAGKASTDAAAAVKTANSASSTASGAVTTANEAAATANAASDTATAAQTMATENQSSIKQLSDSITSEVTERGKLAGRVGTLEGTTGTHTSKLQQLAASITSLVKGESTYTDPDGKSATSGIYSLVTQTRDSVTALFGQYTKTADLASTQAVKDAKKAGTDAASAASAAQSTADTAKANAATAQSTADRAQSTADAALDNAGTANGRVRAVEARVSASIDGLDVRVRGVSEAVSAQGATVRDVERNMSFGLDGLVIGAADSASKVRITDKRETFEVDGKTVLALDGDTSTVEASALKIGGYVWTATNGGKNLTLVYRG